MAIRKIPVAFSEGKPSDFRCGQLLAEKTKVFDDSYELDTGRRLGKGTFGEVCVCKNKESNKELACKTLLKENVRTEDDKSGIQKEIKILRSFQNQHKSIIQLVDVFESDVALHVVMELCKGGDLFELLKSKGRLPEPAARLVFRQLASAIDLCHSKGVLHRDIKPENVLFQGNTDWLYLMGIATDFQAPVHVKLADFGLSVALRPGETAHSYIGSRFYVSPEMIQGKPYGRRTDIWSLGIVLCAMLTGRLPFSGKDRDDDDGLLRAIVRGKINFNTPSWDGVSDCAKDLVRGMLQVEPANRLRALDIHHHPWLTKRKPWSAASLLEDAALEDTRLRQTQSVTSAVSATPSSDRNQQDTVRLRGLATEEFPLGHSSAAATTLLKGTRSRGAPAKPRSEESFRVGAGRFAGGEERGEKSLHRSSSLIGSLSRHGSKLLSVMQGRNGKKQEADVATSSRSIQRLKTTLTAEELMEPLKLVGDGAVGPWLPLKPQVPSSKTQVDDSQPVVGLTGGNQGHFIGLQGA